MQDNTKELPSHLPSKRWLTPKSISKLYPDVYSTEAAVRDAIFKARSNGLHVCIRRLGRKILFDLAQFEQWVDSHGGDM